MSDMKPVITPKSDQLNADDLISGAMTIEITSVDIKASVEQPVSIGFLGDNKKPYKPCKSMCRVMVNAWGADAKKYIGRSMTLFRDPTVKWGGVEIGGIRISHLSHIDATIIMMLTENRKSRKPYHIHPLKKEDSVMLDSLKQEAKARAQSGMTALVAWFNGITSDEKHMIKPHMEPYKTAAKKADEARAQEMETA
jgi:hypothetical protein